MIEYVTRQEFLILIAKMVAIFGGLMGALAYITLLERKLMAWVQMRPGPNRVGPFGLLQPLADGMKFLFKEDIIPNGADVAICVMAPALSLIPAFISFAVIPFGPSLQITDLNVGPLFVFAATSVSVYGIVLGGWASNSKYSLMGGLRASAQMISYELSLTLSVVGVLMIANTLSLQEIVTSQQGLWFGLVPRWNIFLQPVGFMIFLISAIAETNRLPFDLAEAEQELVAGWHTEYSSMKFAMFFLAEYANMVTASAIATILFFGGWGGPMFGPPLLQVVLPTVWFLMSVVAWIGAEMEFALSQAVASGDTFEHRPAECGHCVQDFLADLDLRDLPGEAAGSELGADDALPPADLRFYPAALVVPCGHLPGHAAVAADLGNMAIPNGWIPRRLRADHCVLWRRYNHIQGLPIPFPQQIPCGRSIIGAVSQKARDRGIHLIQEPG